MRICDDLRQAVLQAAIQGKLTKQLPEDGDAEDLLKEIAKEKSQLIKERKVKKEKPLPEIKLDEVPFDIPDNWMWVRLGDCGATVTGNTPSTSHPEFYNGDMPFIGPGDISYSGVISYETKKKLTHIGSEHATVLNKGSVLQVCIGGSLGKCAVIDRLVAFNQQINGIRPLFIEPKYIQMVISQERNIKSLRAIAGGTATPIVNRGIWDKTLIPLPPLEEQHRIVARVEELMARIDDLEKTETELEKLKAAFPGDMKAALLQAAVQGKLTEQLSEDGDVADLLNQIVKEKNQLIKEGKIKKEKPLPAITSDEVPFDIPENWKWIRLGLLVSVISGTSYNKNQTCNSGLRIARGGNLINEEIVLLDNDVFLPKDVFFDEAKCIQPKDIVIVASTGSLKGIGRAAFCNKQLDDVIQIGAFLRIVRCVDKRLFGYVSSIFKGYYYKKWIRNSVNGIGIQNIKEEHITNMLIPLPPLAEQKRIVEKLNKLLPLCDGLVEE